MKKFLLLLTVLLTTTLVATAQPIKLGVKGGLNLNSSSLSLSEGITGITASSFSESVKSNTGYHIGLTARISLLGLYVQGDALYVHNSQEFSLENETYESVENRLDIPIVAGFKFLFLRIYAGPRFMINLGDNIKTDIKDLEGTAESFEDAWENRALGYTAGIGMDLGKNLALDFSYNGSFSSSEISVEYLKDNITETLNLESNNKHFRLSLTYFF